MEKWREGVPHAGESVPCRMPMPDPASPLLDDLSTQIPIQINDFWPTMMVGGLQTIYLLVLGSSSSGSGQGRHYVVESIRHKYVCRGQ